MVRYFYAWTPLVIVGTVVLLSLPWLPTRSRRKSATRASSCMERSSRCLSEMPPRAPVRRLTGVRVVDNLIKLKPSEPAAADVERRVQDAIARTTDLFSHSIRVTMNDGTVHLHGQVPSLAALQTALRAAETAPGVTAVDSEIAVTIQEDRSQ
jgi:osmotically-inducible protein OsmY